MKGDLDPMYWGYPPSWWQVKLSYPVFWIKTHKLLVGFIAVMIFLFGTITAATMWLSPDARAAGDYDRTSCFSLYS